MRIVTLSTLYPNAEMPNFSIFVENRLRHLVASGAVSARVVAPVPWFPFKVSMFGAYARQARIPRAEVRHGIEILHPRYVMVPGPGMYVQPWTLYAAVKPVLAQMIAAGDDFDLIDAHYFYPTGVAAAMLGRAFGKPVVITGRGSDLTVIPEYDLPRRMIAQACRCADGFITVSGALKESLIALGADAGKIRVLRNGVDLSVFKPLDRVALRQTLGLSGPVLLSVGNLVPGKAHDLTIRALADLPDMTLLIAGTGPEDAALKALAASLNVAERVRFLGAVPHQELAGYYNAADALVHASAREGMANVLLEALACGTPIVGSPIPGMDEVVGPAASGLIMAARTPEGLAAAVRTLLANPPERGETRAYAEAFSWDATTRGQIEFFQEILAGRAKTAS